MCALEIILMRQVINCTDDSIISTSQNVTAINRIDVGKNNSYKLQVDFCSWWGVCSLLTPWTSTVVGGWRISLKGFSILLFDQPSNLLNITSRILVWRKASPDIAAIIILGLDNSWIFTLGFYVNSLEKPLTKDRSWSENNKKHPLQATPWFWWYFWRIFYYFWKNRNKNDIVRVGLSLLTSCNDELINTNYNL